MTRCGGARVEKLAHLGERMTALEGEWLASEEVADEPAEWRSLSPEFVKALYPAPGAK